MPKLKNAIKKTVKKSARKAVKSVVRYLNVPDHEATLVGLTDPFSAEAARTQYPDAGAGRSLVFQQRLTGALTTDAQGFGAAAFNPKVNLPILAYATIAGNVVTWAGAWSGSFSGNLVNTYAQNYRPTSMGLKILNNLSATQSSGSLFFCKGGPPAGGTTTFTPTNFSNFAQEAMLHGGEWHMVSNPRTSSAFDLQPPSNTATSTADPDWETLYIFINGSQASSTALSYELVINYEYTCAEDAAIAQLQMPQPILNTHIQTAVNEIQSSHPTVHKAGGLKAHLKREAKKALTKHVLPFAAKTAMQLL